MRLHLHCRRHPVGPPSELGLELGVEMLPPHTQHTHPQTVEDSVNQSGPLGALLGLGSPGAWWLSRELPRIHQSGGNGGIAGRVTGPPRVQVDQKPRVWEGPLLKGLSGVCFQLNMVAFSGDNQCLRPTRIQRAPKASDMSLERVKGWPQASQWPLTSPLLGFALTLRASS